MKNFIIAGALIAALTPAVALAQTNAPGGVATGAATGAVGGLIVGGPIGAAVGAVGGAIVGGIVGDQQPQFRQYVVKQAPASYRYEQPVTVGGVLPETGITYYDVPPEYKVQGYRYTYVNETPVLVDPKTRRIVQIIQ